jgi:hypothetical protein
MNTPRCSRRWRGQLGIPARMAGGIVYMDDGFYYHALARGLARPMDR